MIFSVNSGQTCLRNIKTRCLDITIQLRIYLGISWGYKVSISCNKFLTIVFFPLELGKCQSNESNNCEQVCVNVPGSFLCECRDGYKLNSDGKSCEGKIFA